MHERGPGGPSGGEGGNERRRSRWPLVALGGAVLLAAVLIVEAADNDGPVRCDGITATPSTTMPFEYVIDTETAIDAPYTHTETHYDYGDGHADTVTPGYRDDEPGDPVKHQFRPPTDSQVAATFTISATVRYAGSGTTGQISCPDAYVTVQHGVMGQPAD